MPKTPLAVSMLEATAVAAIRHPRAVVQLFDGCMDLAFNGRLRTLARRPDSVGAAASALLAQIEAAAKAKP
jgi:type VI protein secretion system component VasF